MTKTKMLCRMMSLLLCALLCAAALPAFAAPGDTVLYPQPEYGEEAYLEEGEAAEMTYLSSVAVMPDGVYAIVNDTLVTRWQPGDEAPVTLFEMKDAMGYYAAYTVEGEEPVPEEQLEKIEANIHRLIPGDDGLYGINLATMQLARVSDTGYEFMDVALSLPEMQVLDSEWGALREWYDCFIFEGSLFLLLGSEQENDWDSRLLYRAPLDGSDYQAYELSRLATATPYKDGKLLAGVETTTAYSYGLDLVELDIATGTPGKTVKQEVIKRSYSPSAFAYAPEEDAVYFLDENQVKRLDVSSGEIMGLAFVAASSYGGSESRTGWLSEGYFAVSQYSGIYIRNTDPAYKVERALRISGGWEDEAYRKFTKEHPEIPVLLLETDIWGEEAIAQAIQTGETEVDIFTLYTNGSMAALLDKGYAADLSASEALTRDVADMYPWMQEALHDAQGNLRAYPASFYYQPLLVNMTLFEEYFPGEELPETWAEYLTLYLRFQEDPPDDVAFLDYFVDKNSLVYEVLREFSRRYEQDGGEADFQHPALREALELLAQLPEGEQIERWGDLTGDELATLNDYYSRQNIFTTEVQLFENLEQRAQRERTVSVSSGGGMMITESYGSDMEPDPEKAAIKYQLMTPPVFEAGQEPQVQAQFMVMIVNPASSNLDFAMQYLEAMVDSVGVQTRYALHPELSEPVRSSYYASNLRSSLRELEELEEALPDMEPEEKQETEDYIETLKQRMERDEKTDWEISAQAIAAYREIAPYVVLEQGGVFNMGGDEGGKQIYELIDKYIAGQLQLDPFLKELDGKAKMMRREAM